MLNTYSNTVTKPIIENENQTKMSNPSAKIFHFPQMIYRPLLRNVWPKIENEG